MNKLITLVSAALAVTSLTACPKIHRTKAMA